MDVLIAFVTPSDPQSKNPNRPGPAQTVTAAKALEPDCIHLLYTSLTKPNMEETKEFLSKDPKLKKTEIIAHKLDLPDARDYQRLKELVPDLLKSIRYQHPGGRFHLVSGHPQMRMIMALCLASWVLDGSLYEVENPDPANPWPKVREGYQQRLKVMDTSIFEYFRELSRRQLQAVRLRIDLALQQAWLDGNRLDLRSTTSRRGLPGDRRSRAFALLVLLAAKKRYGGVSDVVPKALIRATAYSDQSEASAPVNIRRAIHSLNRQARRLTAGAKKPLDPLIVDVKRGGRSIGCYRLTNRLNPPDETIEFVGDLHQFLKRLGVKVSGHDARVMFPNLP